MLSGALSPEPLRWRSLSPETPSIGASRTTYTILGVPYYSYRKIFPPQSKVKPKLRSLETSSAKCSPQTRILDSAGRAESRVYQPCVAQLVSTRC